MPARAWMAWLGRRLIPLPHRTPTASRLLGGKRANRWGNRRSLRSAPNDKASLGEWGFHLESVPGKPHGTPGRGGTGPGSQVSKARPHGRPGQAGAPFDLHPSILLLAQRARSWLFLLAQPLVT